MDNIKSVIEKLNHFLEKSNCSDFCIKCFDGFILNLVGSFDLCYYHEVEIIFINVYKISMETTFFIDCDRKPFQVQANADYDGVFEIVITDDTNTNQSIICENIDLIIERVKYYDDNGNRIV